MTIANPGGNGPSLFPEFPEFPADPRWGELFINAVAANARRSRLARGESYLRENRLISPEIMPGVLTARVQGSQRRPYRVQVTTPLVGHRERRILSALLREKPEFAAAMKRGELPPDLDGLTLRAGAPLIPRKFRHFCTCPDAPASPCKHAAALCFLAAEEFAGHPLHLLLWRGLEESWWHDTFVSPPDYDAMLPPPRDERDGEAEEADELRGEEAASPAGAPGDREAAAADPATAAVLESLRAPWPGPHDPDLAAQPLVYRLGPLPGDEAGEPETRRLRQLATILMLRARAEADAFKAIESARDRRPEGGRPFHRRRRRR